MAAMNGAASISDPFLEIDPDKTVRATTRTTWYERVDMVAHKVQRMQTITMILLAFVIVSGGISFNNAILEQNNVYSQMHAVPYSGTPGAPPANYASMDWVMTAKRVMVGASIGWVGGVVSQELCLDGDNEHCNPVWWQTHEGCNSSAATQLRIPPEVIEEQAYFYRSTRTKYKHLQPMFTCLAEKIGDVAVYQNNEHSYSIGSTHNTNVLVATVFMICAVIFSTMIIATWKRSGGQEEIENEYLKRMILTALVLFYIVVTYLYATSSSNPGNKDEHRPVGLASHAYSTVFLLLSLLIFNQSGTLREHANEYDRIKRRADALTKVSPAGPEEDSVAAGNGQQEEDGVITAYPAMGAPPQYQPPQPVASQQGFQMAALNVRRFVQEPMHYDTRIKQPIIFRPQPSEQNEPFNPQNTVTVDVCALISSPVHSKFVYGQLLTLPLALMALCMHGRNFGLDTYTQMVFVSAGVYCLVDVFLYRMWWAFQIHKGVTFFLKDDVGEYRAMEVLTLLCILVQVSIFTFFIVSELFDKSYMWFFVVHIIFTSVAKIVAVMAIRQHKQIFSYGGQPEKPSSNFDRLTGTLQKSDFYMFVTYTILLSIVLWIYVIQDQRKLDAAWTDRMPLVERWGPGWQTYNAMSI